MRWTRWTFLAIVLVALGALAAVGIAADKKGARPDAAARAGRLARGQYLVNALGCGDCHTPGTMYGAPDLSRRLSGSELGWRGPWGVSYARNLSPDLETGLGYWSEDELVHTLKTGVKPDGKTLLPPMPWPNTALLSDEDLRAVAAYLMSIPAVSHKVPEAVPPDQAAAATGSILDLPPPSAWDAPRPAPGGDAPH